MKEEKTKLSRRIFEWIFRRTIADIIYNSEKSIQLRQVLILHRSAVKNYIELIELTIFDIDKYFTRGSGLSARRAMRDIRDVFSAKLETLKKIDKEYLELEKINNYEILEEINNESAEEINKD